MRAFVLFTLLLMAILPAAGQAPETSAPAPTATINVESAFMRAEPSQEAELAGSAYDGEILMLVGRSADGSWLNVHRPWTPERRAWIRRDLVSTMADLTRLPLTDFTTGVTGPEPLADTGFAALFTGQAQLRERPDRDAASAGVVPIGVIVPIVERTPNNFWLKVNYLGTVGWVAEFTTATSADFTDIPIAPELADNPIYAALVIVPPEVQVAQIDRLLEYLAPSYATADAVSHYWREMLSGETMECLPPGDVAPYEYGPADLSELPELRRQSGLLNQAVTDINESLAIMRRCGVYVNSEVRSGYANAVAARNTFDLIRRRLVVVRELLAGEE